MIFCFCNDTATTEIYTYLHPLSLHDALPIFLREIIHRFPWLRHVFADGGYAGDKLREALRRIGKWTVEIVKRSDVAKGFVVLPRRWVVERTLAWLNRNRRLAKDFEQTIASATARSEEHTSELQSLMRISYAVFCLTKKKHTLTTQSK